MNTTIEIINAVGKVLVNQNAKSYINKIDLSHLPVGFYFVRVSSEKGSFAQKIIKK